MSAAQYGTRGPSWWTRCTPHSLASGMTGAADALRAGCSMGRSCGWWDARYVYWLAIMSLRLDEKVQLDHVGDGTTFSSISCHPKLPDGDINF
jgi:hypothetical protein